MYGTIQGWKDYVASRGIQGISVPDDDPSALVRASDYIKYHYVANFMVGYDETLHEVELAAYEAACIELKKPGFFSKTYAPSEAKILMQMGSLRWEKVGSSNSGVKLDQSPMVLVSTKIDMFLRRYVKSQSIAGMFSVGPNVNS